MHEACERIELCMFVAQKAPSTKAQWYIIPHTQTCTAYVLEYMYTLVDLYFLEIIHTPGSRLLLPERDILEGLT